MRNIEILKKQLIELVNETNASLGVSRLSLHQQKVCEYRMSVTGGNGRLCIHAASDGYRIGLSGMSLTNELSGFMCELTGKEHDSYEFPADKKMPK